MSRAVWGLWILLVVFANIVTSEQAMAADELEEVDDREASFLPPPESILKVEPPVSTPETGEQALPKAKTGSVASDTKAAVTKPSAEVLITPPPFTPKTEKAPVANVKPAMPVAPSMEASVEKANVEKASIEKAKATPPVVVAPEPVRSLAARAVPASTPIPTPAAASVPAPAPAPAVAPAPISAAASSVATTPAFPPSAPSPAAEAIPSVAGAPPSPQPVASLGEEISTMTLADVDPETLGLLSASNGGLGSALWKETDRVIVDRLMPAVALPTASSTLNDLARRMFLSTAAAPRQSTQQKSARSLLSQRIEALMALGAVADAWKLASLADPKLVDEVTLRLLTEAALIGPDSKEICDKMPSLIAAHATTEESGGAWQKSLLVCQLRAGDVKAVQLGVDLMREQHVKDVLFLSLINKNVLANSLRLPRQLTPLRPLNLAVLRQINLPLPPELYARAEAPMIPELLRAKSSNEGARVLLAEKSAARGLLTATQLGDVYKDIVFTPEDIAKANSQTEASPTSRAMAFQALANEQAPQKKIDLVQKVTSGLSLSALIGTQGSLITSYLENIPVIADYNAFSVTLARTFALAGKPDKAMVWLNLARAAAAQGGEIKSHLIENWPLFVLSGLVADGEYAQGLKDWLDVALTVPEGSDNGNALYERRALCGNILLLLNALGYAVNEEAWERVIEPQPPTRQMVPATLLVERMAQAAAADRKGEMILLGLLMEGSSSETATPFAVKIGILRALRQTGLMSESQSYAREILVGLTN
ncbi:MAG: hypothetical protein PHD48_00300 [Alphaproteobacteria bacterium]|nr:hypothetical protein [Alphaproteobacteria bacterium]